MYKKMILGICIIMILLVPTSAHKDAAESAVAGYEYRISIGLNPVHNVVNQEQNFYFKVEDYTDGHMIDNLKARFIIYKDMTAFVKGSEELYLRSPDNRIANYEVFESAPGIYKASHVFTEPGIYLLVSRLYDETKKDSNVLKEKTQYIQVEPEGPSPIFWSFIGLSLVIGAGVASRSHK